MLRLNSLSVWLTVLPALCTAGCNDAATAEVALMLILMLMRRVDEAR
jgi:lactate dehydrogenase-like 2-hydroxyacid dehydrogenase